MQGVVPAAGEGTRLQPLTADRPKGLVDVAGRPLLSYAFLELIDLGVEELLVVVGYRGDQIRDHFGDVFETVPITYVTQAERRGLAHAVACVAPQIEGDFLLMNGDNVCDANLEAVVSRHRETDAVATSLAEEVSRERAKRGGVFERSDGEIVGLVEKPAEPPTTCIPRGFYALDDRVSLACQLVRAGHTGERELTEALDLLCYAGWPIEAVPLEGWCVNVNTPADRDRVAERLEAES